VRGQQAVLAADREHHDRIAERYDAWFVWPLQYRLLNAELVDEVARVFSPGEGLLVEFGAGTGGTVIPFCDRGYRVLAVDSSEGMLEVLSRKRPDVRTLTGDVSAALPLEDGAAGCVVISQTLHHILDKAGVLREARRILRARGRLCIFEPQTLPGPLDVLRRFAQRCCCPGEHVEAEAPIDPQRLRRSVEAAGFRVLKEGATFFLPFDPTGRLARAIVRRLWRLPGRIPLLRRLGGVCMLCAEKC